MDFIYAVQDERELAQYQDFVRRQSARLKEYLAFLEKHYAVSGLPRAIVLAGEETATRRVSDIPVPSYTNEYRVMFTPSLEVWKKIYLKQLAPLQKAGVEESRLSLLRRYYETLGENHVMQILGHEFVHHSELFVDGFDDDYEDGVWFEEGMAEYISRRYFLTEQEFAAEREANRVLVELLTPYYGGHPLEKFGLKTYAGDYASIFFEYWRSFLAVERLIQAHHGDIMAVFASYQEWNAEKSPLTLSEWFGI